MTAIAAAGARVWRVGAQVDTDQLAPGHAMKHGIEVVARHCLESVRPDFAAGVRPGDVLVAGPDFGIGSSREQAASALVHLGLAAVVAPSFSGLYFRNAFNVGLLLLTCERAEEITEGERIDFDAAAGRIVRPGGELLPTQPIPGFLLDMVAAGGLLAQLQQRSSRRTTP
ncbi:3-isopropylmalate dehydratase [Ramlibacter sp. RBP-2]|uniref:3-isopropylmalate dehydratase n=1 Tax=Ramlibacter lithotrophicus TaxID=2606681 RepID=A0A7X6DKY2_9BURK|nr:3-isopropylmalate dehydratase [Ramlibacter lithotrophicus]NKE69080.1 3-isopropylmalate dehydratase [Ramlibacter lithotrophicus]